MSIQQDPGDEALKQALGEWKISSTLPPRFADGVWNRIAAGESCKSARRPGWAGVFSALLAGWFSRPALAVVYLAALVASGSLIGFWQGNARSARVSLEMGTKYVQMVDPYQMPHH
ncbi:MAG: hypothetical protein U1F98_09985 [Verrucomicrobiota bacterium]